MNYADFMREDMRLVILRLLTEVAGFRSNSSILLTGLERIGHAVSCDQVKTELRWLQEQGLVTVSEVGPVLVVELTGRGEDAAAGRARVDGVKRPRARG